MKEDDIQVLQTALPINFDENDPLYIHIAEKFYVYKNAFFYPFRVLGPEEVEVPLHVLALAKLRGLV